MDKCLLSLNNTGVIYSSASKYGLLPVTTTTTAASEVSAASIKPFSESSVSRALAHSTTTLLPLCLCCCYTELQIYIWLPPEAPVTTDVVGCILLLAAAAAAVGIHVVVCTILSLEAVGVEAAEVTVC